MKGLLNLGFSRGHWPPDVYLRSVNGTKEPHAWGLCQTPRPEEGSRGHLPLAALWPGLLGACGLRRREDKLRLTKKKQTVSGCVTHSTMYTPQRNKMICLSLDADSYATWCPRKSHVGGREREKGRYKYRWTLRGRREKGQAEGGKKEGEDFLLIKTSWPAKLLIA